MGPSNSKVENHVDNTLHQNVKDHGNNELTINSLQNLAWTPSSWGKGGSSGIALDLQNMKARAPASQLSWKELGYGGWSGGDFQNLKGRFEGLPCDQQDAPISEIQAKIRSLQQKAAAGNPEPSSGL